MKYFKFCNEFLRAIEYKRIVLCDGIYYLEMEDFPTFNYCPWCGRKLEDYDSHDIEKGGE